MLIRSALAESVSDEIFLIFYETGPPTLQRSRVAEVLVLHGNDPRIGRSPGNIIAPRPILSWLGHNGQNVACVGILTVLDRLKKSCGRGPRHDWAPKLLQISALTLGPMQQVQALIADKVRRDGAINSCF